MFREYLRLVFSLVRSPFLLMIALLAVCANMTLIGLLEEPLAVILNELLYGPTAGIGSPNAVLYLVFAYSTELFLLLGAIFVSVVVNSWAGIAFARFAKRQQERKTEVFESAGFAVQKLGVVLLWSVWLFLIAGLFTVLLGIVAWVGQWHWILFLLGFLIWIVLAIPTGLLLMIGLPVIAVENVSIKDGLKKTGGFLKKHFFGTVFFLVILSVLLSIIDAVSNGLSGSVADPNWALFIVGFFWLVQIVFSNLAVPFYYLSEEYKRK